MLNATVLDSGAEDRTPTRRYRTATLVAHELRIMRRSPEALLVHGVMPLVAVVILTPILEASLVVDGYAGAPGAALAVPAVVVLFSFIVVGYAAAAVFNEQTWRTWDRLRASPAQASEVVLGKAIPYFLLLVVQMALIFAFGFVVLDLRLEGSLVGLLIVAGSYALCLASLGILLVSVVRTTQQINMLSNVGSLVFAALGGAIVPLSEFPSWARNVAPAVPSHWAVRGFREVMLGDGTRPAVAAVVLLGFTIAFLVAASLRFRADEGGVT